ncbi:MAG: DUF3987 domain-containing protein [Terriglobia bacterium]
MNADVARYERELAEKQELAQTILNGHGPKPARSEGPAWPKPLAHEAFYGLVGEIVNTLEPYTEADSAGILIQVHTCFGSVIGRGPHFPIEADRHGLNLFAVLVGDTSKGRKGVSYGRAKSLFEQADGHWAESRIASGLSSGEGLLHAVRDPITRHDPIRERGRVVGYQDIEADPGEADKRLLVYEPEFALVLRVMARDGNSLSAVIRQAWDTGNLRTLTRNNPLKAVGAHISIVAHVTRTELHRYLDSTEMGNGFANRFLWVCVARSKCLPDNEDRQVEPTKFAGLTRQIADAVQFAGSIGEMGKDSQARADWRAVYPALSAGKPGMLGAVTSRAEAQTMRLACIYALLDKSAVIRREHLRAALAVWTYCEQSAAYIFGHSLGDPVADNIMRALKEAPGGLTRTEISNVFGRNRDSGQINRALDALREAGRARSEFEQTEGRKAERWFAV